MLAWLEADTDDEVDARDDERRRSSSDADDTRAEDRAFELRLSDTIPWEQTRGGRRGQPISIADHLETGGPPQMSRISK